jgi:hypothetical protein
MLSSQYDDTSGVRNLLVHLTRNTTCPFLALAYPHGGQRPIIGCNEIIGTDEAILGRQNEPNGGEPLNVSTSFFELV